MTEPLKDHKIVSENEWIESHKALLKKEKEFTILPTMDIATIDSSQATVIESQSSMASSSTLSNVMRCREP
jgi:hypothetical protein